MTADVLAIGEPLVEFNAGGAVDASGAPRPVHLPPVRLRLAAR
jgi:hypothetical protein